MTLVLIFKDLLNYNLFFFMYSKRFFVGLTGFFFRNSVSVSNQDLINFWYFFQMKYPHVPTRIHVPFTIYWSFLACRLCDSTRYCKCVGVVCSRQISSNICHIVWIVPTDGADHVRE